MMFFGSYKEDNLQFRVVSVEEEDGHRVVIMSDLGMKLQDMKLRSDGETDIYFAIEYMPKNIIESFADFSVNTFQKIKRTAYAISAEEYITIKEGTCFMDKKI